VTADRSQIRLLITEVLQRLERHIERRELRRLRGLGELPDCGFELLQFHGDVLERAVDRFVARGERLIDRVHDALLRRDRGAR
jgi:hypothetical protein